MIKLKTNKDNITQNTGDIADNKQKLADNTTAINKMLVILQITTKDCR